MFWIGFFTVFFLVVLLVALFGGEGEKYGKWQSNRKSGSHPGSGFMF